ncbi:hypothetical protein Mlute_02794 [Meiothermus luteus]|uniref:Uncharacterized protein n=1 Tax=Meiothermus luteus TaxID=2026184 RepID=A0A399ECE8_9DEIN|nr:hypothetical protein Mlute_02794 [Meiothermus luteus]
MDEDIGPPPVQLGPKRLKQFISQVAPPHLGEKGHPVQPQDVQGVGQLCQHGLHVGQWQGSQGRIAAGMLAQECCVELVGGAGQLPGLGPVSQEDPRRGQRNHRGGNSIAGHHLKLLFHRPGRHRGRAQGLGHRRGVVGGLEVSVQVEAHAHSKMATTRAGAALAPTMRRGKQATLKPVLGRAPRLHRRSSWA